MTKALSLLGISKKAGFLEIGEESVSASARTKKARVILSASDASDSSKRRARGHADTFGIPYTVFPATKADLAVIIGRGAPGMVAVTDAGLAFGIVSRLNEEAQLLGLNEAEELAELAAALQAKAERVLKRRRETRAHEKKKKSGARGAYIARKAKKSAESPPGGDGKAPAKEEKSRRRRV